MEDEKLSGEENKRPNIEQNASGLQDLESQKVFRENVPQI